MSSKSEMLVILRGQPLTSNQDNNQRSRNALIEENLHLVESRLKFMHGINFNNYDDVIQAGRLGLCRAAASFNRHLGIQFSTYAVTAIDNEMHRAIRACFDKCNPVSLGNILESENNLTGTGLIQANPDTSSPELIYEQKMAKDALPSLIPLYPHRHRSALLAMVMRMEGYSKKQIVNTLGINSSSYRNKIHKTAIKLKNDSAFMQYVDGISNKSIA